MNCVLFGRERDAQLIELVARGKAFTRRQLQDLIFANIKDPEVRKRRCQARTSKLIQRKELKRFYKDDLTNCAIYYTEKKPININHILSINDVFCSFMTQRPDLDIEWEWEYQIYDGLVQADSYINIFSPDKKFRKVVFLEVECDPRKLFNKDTQYQKVYDKDWNLLVDGKPTEEWVVVENGKAIFPTILIVTDYPPKMKKSDVKFTIASPEEVQKDVYSVIRLNKKF